jgi:hypothetical protein
MIVAPIGEAVNQPGIAVIREDDRLIDGEHGIEIHIREAVRMFARWLNGHQIDNVHHANLDVGKMLPQEIDGRQSFKRRHVPGAGHDDIGLGALSVLAHSQMPMPVLQCSMADSMSRYCNAGCLPATITLT